MSGKYFLQSGLRVLELLVKMDIVYEDKDKIILNKPAGQLSQSGKSFEMDLVSEVLTYRKSRLLVMESMVEIWQSRQLKG